MEKRVIKMRDVVRSIIIIGLVVVACAALSAYVGNAKGEDQIRAPQPITKPCEPVVCTPDGDCIIQDCRKIVNTSMQKSCGTYACCKADCYNEFVGGTLRICLRTCRYTFCRRTGERWYCQ